MPVSRPGYATWGGQNTGSFVRVLLMGHLYDKLDGNNMPLGVGDYTHLYLAEDLAIWPTMEQSRH